MLLLEEMPATLALLRLQAVVLLRRTRATALTERLWVLVIAVALGWASWKGYQTARTFSGAMTIVAAAIALTWMIHTSRRDVRFLKMSAASVWLVLFVDYLALGAPIALLLLGARTPNSVMLLLVVVTNAGVCAAVAGRRHARSKNLAPNKLLPARAFEWVSGCRATFGAIVFCYVLAAAGAFFPGAALAATAGLACLTAVFYLQSDEGLFLVHAFRAPDARHFLEYKMLCAASSYLCLASPMALIAIARERATLVPAMMLLFCGALLQVLAVLRKYSSFSAGRRSPIRALELIGLGAAALAAPLGLVVAGLLWRRAADRLNALL